jgi:hypothetical protein
MCRATTIAVTFLLLLGSVRGQDKEIELAKVIDLGPLEEYFKLVAVDQVADPNRGGTITLKLEARKDVDTSLFFCKVGFFDKEKHLHLASPLRFSAAFPLQKGETIQADAWEGRTPQNWHRIAIRRVEKPTVRSEYHNQ